MIPLNHRSTMKVVPICARQSEKRREDHGAVAGDDVARDVQREPERRDAIQRAPAARLAQDLREHHETTNAHSGRRTSECVTPRWFARYSTGPTKATTKSRSGAAQAKNPAAMRRGSERGGASFGAVARASSAPESAWVRVSTGMVRRPSPSIQQQRAGQSTLTPACFTT